MHKTRTPNTKSEMFCSRWTINNDIWVRFAPLLPFANQNTVVQSRWLSKGETEITENREYCWNCEWLKENIEPELVFDWHFSFQLFRIFFLSFSQQQRLSLNSESNWVRCFLQMWCIHHTSTDFHHEIDTNDSRTTHDVRSPRFTRTRQKIGIRKTVQTVAYVAQSSQLASYLQILFL